MACTAARVEVLNGEVKTDDAFGTMLDDVTVSVGPKGVGGAEEVVGLVVDPERSAGDDEKEEEEAVEEELIDGDEMMSGVEDVVEVAVADWALVTIVMGASASTGTTVDAMIGALACDEEEVGVVEMMVEEVVVVVVVVAADSVVSVAAVVVVVSSAQKLQSVVNVVMSVPCGLMMEALVMKEAVDVAMDEETGNGPCVNIPIAVLAVLVRAQESAPLA